MSDVSELLRLCRQKGLRIRLQGDQLKVRVPQDVDAGSLLAQLKERKEEVLALLQEVAPISTIPQRENGTDLSHEELPLSWSQERLWFLEQLHPSTVLHNIPGVLYLKGHLDVAALTTSCRLLLQRHESLRTCFPTNQKGLPYQKIKSANDVVFRLQRETVQEQHINPDHPLITSLIREPFSLAEGPLFRCVLVQYDEQNHLLLIILHHIIGDGWSIQLLNNEISFLYQAIVKNRSESFSPEELLTQLSPMPLQFVEYALWQRQFYTEARLQPHLAFWQKQLEGSKILQLPTDKPRSAIQSDYGSQVELILDTETTEALQAIARENNASLFMVLLAGFQYLLSLFADQKDIVIGTPVANRNRHEFANIVGFFVNMIPLRTDLSQVTNFDEVLQRTQKTCFQAFQHQELPFEKLVSSLNLPRTLDSTPLFNVMFSLHDEKVQLPDFGDQLETRALPFDSQIARYDLSWNVFTNPAPKLVSSLEYCSDLFEQETIQSLGCALKQLFRSLAKATTVAPTTSPLHRRMPALLSAEEHLQQLQKGQGAAATLPPQETILSVIARNMQEKSEVPVLLLDGMELNGYIFWWRVKLIASELRDRGIKPGDRIGVWMDRDFDLPVTLLGIWACGAAYVPLSSEWTKEQRLYVLQDAQLTALLCSPNKNQQTQQEGMEQYLPCWFFALGDWESRWAGRPFPELCQPTSEMTCYLLYTSGSTGQPKGVELSHQALLNHLQWLQKEIPLASEDRVLHKTSPTFDVSVWELFWPLFAGATLVFSREGDERDPRRLLDWIQTCQVTTLHLVPSMLSSFLDFATQEKLSSLRHLLCIGESLPPALVARCLQYSSLQLYNLYGPTEAAVAVTLHRCSPTDKSRSFVPLGTVSDNTRMAVVLDDGQQAPAGFAGELWLQGVCLAKGYWNQPEMTKNSFVSSSLSGMDERWYKTGDLVRYTTDGSLEFLGRIDQQIKLRGHRIELEAIEACLLDFPGVKATAVVLSADTGGEFLAAFVEWNGESQLAELKVWTKSQLSQIMQPSVWSELKEWPRLPSGKLDRSTLSERAVGLPVQITDQLSPETPLEVELLLLWEKVLQRRPIGVEDSFFELGGHSLLVIALLLELETLLHCRIPVSSLFEAPSVRAFANLVEEQGWKFEWSSLVPIQPQGEKTPLFLFHGIDGGVFYFYNLAVALGKEHPVYGLQAQGMDGQHLPLLSVEEMASLYLKDIRRVQPHGPYQFGGYCFGAEVALEVIRRLRQQGEDIAFFVAIDKSIERAELTLAPSLPATRIKHPHTVDWKYTEAAFKPLQKWWSPHWDNGNLSEHDKAFLRELWEFSKLSTGFNFLIQGVEFLRKDLKTASQQEIRYWCTPLLAYLPPDVHVPESCFSPQENDSPLRKWLWNKTEAFLQTIEEPLIQQEVARWILLRLLSLLDDGHLYYKPVPYEGGTRGHQAAHRFVDWLNTTRNRHRYFEGDMVLIQTQEMVEGQKDPTRGWDTSCTGEIDLTILPCQHDELFRQPYVELMAGTIKKHLL